MYVVDVCGKHVYASRDVCSTHVYTCVCVHRLHTFECVAIYVHFSPERQRGRARARGPIAKPLVAACCSVLQMCCRML